MLKKLPRCAKCGQPMRFVRSLPAVGGLSELQSYECRGCRETVTIAVDDKNKIRSATENYHLRPACGKNKQGRGGFDGKYLRPVALPPMKPKNCESRFVSRARH